MASATSTVLLLVLVLVLPATASINWIGLRNWNGQQWNASGRTPPPPTPPTRRWRAASEAACWTAARHRLLTKEQARVCVDHPHAMAAVWEAARAAHLTCQEVFADRRWNCSSLDAVPRRAPRELTRGTREQAAVHALASASLVRAVARACAAGVLPHCQCGALPRHPPDGHFQWGGCSDDVRYAKRWAKTFTDAPHKKLLARRPLPPESGVGGWRSAQVVAAANLHNTRAGRKAADVGLQTQCKCHGVSGSCNVKTCWRALPTLGHIGQRLKKLYGTAVEVAARRHGRRGRLTLAPVAINAAVGGAGGVGSSALSEHDLVYTAKSPDYCAADGRTGSVGTGGRWCNASVGHGGADACASMCCGRGHTTQLRHSLERCHCKYVWCCHVTCKTCQTVVQHSTCL